MGPVLLNLHPAAADAVEDAGQMLLLLCLAGLARLHLHLGFLYLCLRTAQILNMQEYGDQYNDVAELVQELGGLPDAST